MKAKKIIVSFSEWQKVNEVMESINSMDSVALPIDNVSFYLVVSSEESLEDITSFLNGSFEEVEITDEY